MRNLEHSSANEINTLDGFARKGYRFKGIAKIHRGDAVFDTVVDRMRNGTTTLQGLADSVRAVALIRVEQALPLVSPGYWGGATETDMRQQYETYWNEINAQWHSAQKSLSPGGRGLG